MAEDDPIALNRKSFDLLGKVVKDFRGRGRGELPPPARRRGGQDGGADSSSIVGALAVSSDDIDSPSNQTWADVPDSVKSLVACDSIDDSAPCWKLESGGGTLYQLVGEITDGALAGVWMVPACDGGTTLYNMAGQVTAGDALQTKTFIMNGGTLGQIKIALIDVEKC